MILSKCVDVVISGTNLKHFEDLWYIIPRYKDSKGRIAIKKGTKINVKVWDLLPSSNVLVEVQCEDCWEKRRVQYADVVYRKNSRFTETWKTLCSSCANHRMSWENNSQYKHWCNRYCEYRYNAKKRGISMGFSTYTDWTSTYPTSNHFLSLSVPPPTHRTDKRHSVSNAAWEQCTQDPGSFRREVLTP